MQIIIATHIVPETWTEQQRLSDYLCHKFPQLPSRKSVKKAIKQGAIYIDGRKGYTGDWVVPNQKIELVDLDKPVEKVFELDMDVVWEDESLAIIRKPAGIPVSGNQFRTVENALLHNITMSTAVDALKRPRAVHRLDAPTSGLLLIAKTKTARIHLGRQFEKRVVQKQYQAIVIGKLSNSGIITNPIEGKEAESHYRVIRVVKSLKNKNLSLVDLYPKTGRTHQLRIHLSGLDCPILGDPLYGKEGLILKHKGLFLSAVGLEFKHPLTEEYMSIKIDTPYKFNALMDREQRRYTTYYA